MDDDFNTGAAVSELFDLVRLLNRYVDHYDLDDTGQRQADRITTLKTAATTLKELSNLLGLFQTPLVQTAAADDALVGQLMKLLIELRSEARQRKDFGTADRIRDGLADLGITLEDRKDGTGWKQD
jgi:cysteinyl-tRNA synthetase